MREDSAIPQQVPIKEITVYSCICPFCGTVCTWNSDGVRTVCKHYEEEYGCVAEFMPDKEVGE